MKFKVGGYVVDGNGIHKETFLEKHGETIAKAAAGFFIGGTALNAATKKDNTSSQGAKEKEIDRS